MFLSGDISARLSGEDPSLDYIDSFDDQDLSPYSGPTSAYGFDASVTKPDAGSSLYYDAPDTDRRMIISHSGLDHYPTQGDEISLWVRTDDVANAGQTDIYWMNTNSEQDLYFARIDWDDDIEIFVFRNGSQQQSDTSTSWSSNPPAAGVWYELRIQWDDGTTFDEREGAMRAEFRNPDGSLVRQTDWLVDSTFDGTNNPTFAVEHDPAATGTKLWVDDASLLTNTSPNPPEELIVEDFESGDLSAWDSNPQGFDVQSGTVYEGNYALEALPGDSGTEQIYSTSGLPYYPERGDHIRFFFYRTGAADFENFHFSWCQQGSSAQFWNDGYSIRIRGDRIELRKDHNNYLVDTRPGYTFPTNEWTQVDIWFDTDGSGDIVIEHRDANGNQLGGTGTVTDTTYDTGNVMIDAAADLSYTYYFDYAHVL